MNRAKIYSNRRGICIQCSSPEVLSRHTWPKPKDSWVSEIVSYSQYHRYFSVIHIHRLIGTVPMDKKNTSGYRRRMVLLFVEKTSGLGRIASIFRVELTIL